MPAQAPPNSTTADGWQTLAEQNLKAWSDATTQLAKSVAESLLAGQSAMGRVIELTSEAWRAMAPQPDGNSDSQAAFENYAQQVRQFVLGFPPGPATTGDLVQLWQLYLQQVQELSQPWLRLLARDAPAHLGRSLPSNRNELLDLSSHYWDAYERTIGRLLGSPSLGYSRELNHLLAEGFDTWQEFLRTGFEYRVVVSDAWVNAFKQTMQRLSEHGEAGKPVTSVEQLIELWTDTADDAFAQLFESKRYLDAQARMLSASMALRRKQQEIVDDLLKGSYIPSRGEVDEAYRTIYELRKDVRDLKKKLQHLESRPGQPPVRKQRARAPRVRAKASPSRRRK